MSITIQGKEFDWNITSTLLERAEDNESYTDNFEVKIIDQKTNTSLIINMKRPLYYRLSDDNIPNPSEDDILYEIAVQACIDKNEYVIAWLKNLNIDVEEFFEDVCEIVEDIPAEDQTGC